MEEGGVAPDQGAVTVEGSMYYFALKSGSGFELRLLSTGTSRNLVSSRDGNCQVGYAVFGQCIADLFPRRAFSVEIA